MVTDRTSFSPKNQVSSLHSKNRSSRPFWIKTLSEFSESGLSVQEFCRLKNLSPSNFYTWRKRLRDEKGEESQAPATFIPLELRTADNSPAPSKKGFPNQLTPFSHDMEKIGRDSGLILQLNEGLKILINKDFHEPTLQRLIQLCAPESFSKC